MTSVADMPGTAVRAHEPGHRRLVCLPAGRAHIGLVWDALRELGADPTSVTPMADPNAVASIGLMQIISDPCMSIAQSIHAIHIAELADNDGWQILIKLALQLDQDDMAAQFKQVLAEEDRHLAEIRQVMEQMCLSEAGV